MSLISYPVATDPRAFLPRSVSLAQDVNARSFASPFGGSEQAVDMLNDRWRLSMELPPCTQPDAAKREAFINALRGQVNHTELYHFGRPYPQGTLSSCQGLVYDAPQGADSITIATTAGATLLAGDMLGVDGLLLQCRADCTADANGVLVVPLTNRLRRAISGLRRASTATYVDGSGVLQTAGVDVPRFQGGQLLVEGEGTNLLRQSGDLTNALWGKNNVAAVASAGNGPDGVAGHSFRVYSGALGNDFIQQAPVAPSGTELVASFFVKNDDAIASRFMVRSSVTTAEITIIWSGSAISSMTGGTCGWSPLANGWHRVWCAYVSGESNQKVRFYPDSSSAGKAVYLWGGDAKPGSELSSHIPTTTATATRAADIITPVVWQKPTAQFRLVGRPALRYVPGYSESLALEFVEKVD